MHRLHARLTETLISAGDQSCTRIFTVDQTHFAAVVGCPCCGLGRYLTTASCGGVCLHRVCLLLNGELEYTLSLSTKLTTVSWYRMWVDLTYSQWLSTCLEHIFTGIWPLLHCPPLNCPPLHMVPYCPLLQCPPLPHRADLSTPINSILQHGTELSTPALSTPANSAFPVKLLSTADDTNSRVQHPLKFVN